MTQSTDKKKKPRGADPSKTQIKILDAARELFVESGLNGASMREIAKRADVTQSLLHHHFGSKEALWQKVKSEILAEYFADIERQMSKHVAENGLSFDVAIERRFRFMQDNPDIVRMALWQRLENFGQSSNLKGQDLLKGFISEIKQGQAAGNVCSDIPAGMLIVMYFVLSSGWFQQSYQWIFALDDEINFSSEEEAAEAYLDAAKKIFQLGIDAR